MPGRSTRRAASPWTVCAALALALAAGWSLLPAREPSRESARADFTFVNEGEPSTLDPQQTSGVPEGRLLRFLYEGLVVRHPETLAPLPGAAARWETSADGLTWTFQLQPAGRWSDGTPVEAEDFVFAWRRLRDPATAAPYAGFLDAVRALHARDARTLVVELERPVEFFLELCAHYALAPLPRAQLAALVAREGAGWERAWGRPENLVVNGPYRLVERRIRDRLVFERNEHYWDAAQVALPRVEALTVEHVGTMLNLYLTGRAHWTGNFPLLLAPELLARPDFRPGAQLGTAFYRFNTTRPPLDDARVRRALSLCIDRRALVARVTQAGERPQWSFVPDCAPGYAPVAAAHGADFAADAAAARALLAEAGYGPGVRALPPIELHFNTQANNKDLAEVIADGWRRELGLEARLVNREWKTFLDAQKRLDYDVSRSSWVADHPDAIGMLEIFRAAGPNNRTGWADAQYDALLDQAELARGAERAELLRRAEARLIEAAPIAPLYGYVTKNLVDPRLAGFHENALDEHPPKFWRWKSAPPAGAALGREPR